MSLKSFISWGIILINFKIFYNMNSKATNVGIIGLDIAFPKTFVNQEELEQFDGVSKGKYTIGLGQTNMAFTYP